MIPEITLPDSFIVYRDHYEERAAIMEYVGGMSRALAEESAAEEATSEVVRIKNAHSNIRRP